jgi:hypothetical protein
MGGEPMGPCGVAVIVFTGLLHDGIPGRVLSSTNVGIRLSALGQNENGGEIWGANRWARVGLPS